MEKYFACRHFAQICEKGTFRLRDIPPEKFLCAPNQIWNFGHGPKVMGIITYCRNRVVSHVVAREFENTVRLRRNVMKVIDWYQFFVAHSTPYEADYGFQFNEVLDRF